MQNALQQAMDLPVKVAPDALFTGAIGAAHLSADKSVRP